MKPFKKGLVPAIVQNHQTLEVLMLGYMNEKAYRKTKKTKQVTFFSRSKNRLWTKGESSGHKLILKSIHWDCDKDTILVKVTPLGPTCHNGSRSCFGTNWDTNFILELENIIDERIKSSEKKSYVKNLIKKGRKSVAQKVGEEGVETVIAALYENRSALINEASELLFHLMVLLKSNNLKLKDIAKCLMKRHKS